ncbi:MAG TPA: Rap1a/Tai family immunity protein [Methylophilaceae bacterium]|nr:Rap1a/Tai family immunity protein [Methylophilaceae bacterium]
MGKSIIDTELAPRTGRPQRAVAVAIPFALAGLLVLCTWSAQAAPVTSGDLLNRCSSSEKSMNGGTLSPDETMDAMWCMGYVSGLLDGFSIGDFRVGGAKAVCPPEESLTRSEALKIINQWLREHPQDKDKNGRRSAIIALSKAYPCKK